MDRIVLHFSFSNFSRKQKRRGPVKVQSSSTELSSVHAVRCERNYSDERTGRGVQVRERYSDIVDIRDVAPVVPVT